MTIREMHINIKADLDHINAELVEDFQPEEIDQQINSTINEFVDAAIASKDYKLIETLIKKQQYNASDNIIVYQDYKINLPTDYYDYVNLMLTAKGNHYSSSTDESLKIPCILVKPDIEPALNLNPYENSDSLAWLAEIRDNSIYIYWDEKSIAQVIFLTYVKKPNQVMLSSSIDTDINADLPSNLHQRIVDYTVQRIIKVIKNRQQ